MHSSLSFLVSGQAQHILFFGFVSVAATTPTSLLGWLKEHALPCACKPLILFGRLNGRKSREVENPERIFGRNENCNKKLYQKNSLKIELIMGDKWAIQAQNVFFLSTKDNKLTSVGNTPESFNWRQDVWSGNYSPKMKVFLWSIIQGTLLLGENLLYLPFCARGLVTNLPNQCSSHSC